MSWITRWKPKHVRIDPQHPEALGVCDESDFVFNISDLVEQKEWRGNRLVGTNFYRGRPFLDVHQEQNRPPLVKADPYPVKNPRLPQPDSDGYPLYGMPTAAPQEVIAHLNTLNWTAPVPAPEQTGDPDGVPPSGTPQQIMANLQTLSWGAS